MLRKLDFLSNSPNLFIFQNEKNKTNFGGVMFLAFITLMFIFSLAYILDYCMNVKYEIEYYKEINPSILTGLNKEVDSKLNPEKDFTFHFNEFNEKFTFQFGSQYFHNNSFTIKSKISTLEIRILYKCNYYDKYENCTVNLNDTIPNYKYSINYSSFYIDHNNFENPFQEQNIKIENRFSLYSIINFYWKNIKYQEKKIGLSRLFYNFNKNSLEHINGFIDSFIVEYDKSGSLIFGLDGTLYLVVGAILFKNTINNNIDIYLRSQITFLDLIRNIGTLFTTFYPVFLFFFNIIQKILIIIK